jgi:hypothetical protein
MTRYTLLLPAFVLLFNFTVETPKQETFKDIRNLSTKVDLPPPSKIHTKI